MRAAVVAIMERLAAQYPPPGPQPAGECVCGAPAIRSDRCAPCLTQALAALVGERPAQEYTSALHHMQIARGEVEDAIRRRAQACAA